MWFCQSLSFTRTAPCRHCTTNHFLSPGQPGAGVVPLTGDVCWQLQTKEEGDSRCVWGPAVDENALVTIRSILLRPDPVAAPGNPDTGAVGYCREEDAPGDRPSKRPRTDEAQLGSGSGPQEGVCMIGVEGRLGTVTCYVAELAPYPGKFLPEKAQALGVQPGRDFGRLKQGESVTVSARLWVMAMHFATVLWLVVAHSWPGARIRNERSHRWQQGACGWGDRLGCERTNGAQQSAATAFRDLSLTCAGCRWHGRAAAAVHGARCPGSHRRRRRLPVPRVPDGPD